MFISVIAVEGSPKLSQGEKQDQDGAQGSVTTEDPLEDIVIKSSREWAKMKGKGKSTKSEEDKMKD